MSIELILAFMIGSMIALLLTGRQMFFIIGGIGTFCALVLWGPGGEILPFTSAYSFMGWYPLLAVPPFIFMGLMISRSGAGEKLYRVIYLWIGGLKGGLAVADIGFSCLVACMEGTSVASLTTSATISLPAMFKRKYDTQLVLGEVLANGSLGFLIPPSVTLILYGVIAGVSIGHLWLAAVLPGTLLATMYIIYIIIRCRIQPHLGPAIPPEERASLGEKFRALPGAIAPIILIFAVLGLLFMGVTSLMECAAVGAIGSTIIAAINRKLTWKTVVQVSDETLTVTCMSLWMLSAAIVFSSVLDGLGAIHAVENILTMFGGGRWGTMILMQMSFLGMGMIMDDTAMLFIVAPLYIPIVAHMGFSLVWYGVLYCINCQAALMSPPFGYNLFMMKALLPIVAPERGITITEMYRSVIPFTGIVIACLGVVMAFPQIALWLPSMVFVR